MRIIWVKFWRGAIKRVWKNAGRGLENDSGKPRRVN